MTEQLDELIEFYTVDRQAARAVAQSKIDQVLDTIFAEVPLLQIIIIRGYTPSFNDGDPCYHSQSCVVDVYDPNGVFYDERRPQETEHGRLFTENEWLDWIPSSYNQETKEVIEHDFPDRAHHAGIIKANRLLNAICDEIELIYETNWTLTITRDEEDGDSYSIKKEYYDPGH